MRKLGSLLPLSAVLLGALLTAQGCAPPVPKPPVFNLYGHQRLVVLPFENTSRDPDIAPPVEERLAGKTANVNAIPVIPSSQSLKFLQSLGADPANVVLDEGLRAKVASKFRADLLMTGTITSYEETLKEGDPERRVTNSQTGEGEWGFNTYRRVDLAVIAKIYDPNTGSLLWTESSKGWSYTNTWTKLPIPGSLKIPPVAGLSELLGTVKTARDLVQERDEMKRHRGMKEKPLLYRRSSKFEQLREDSIEQASRYIVGDFYGRGGWTPNMR